MLDMVNRYDRVEVMRSFRLKRIKRPKAVKVKQGVKHDSDIVKSIYKIFRNSHSDDNNHFKESFYPIVSCLPTSLRKGFIFYVTRSE